MIFLRRIKKGVTVCEKGFSFVELMIAITIMGLILIPMLSMFDFGLRTKVRGEKDLVALNLCQSSLEELLADYYQHDHRLLTPKTTVETVSEGYTITSTIDMPNGKIQQLNVSVAYEISGQSKTISLLTRVVAY